MPSNACDRLRKCWWSWTGCRRWKGIAGAWRTRSPRHSTRLRAWRSRSRTATAGAFRHTPPAPIAARRRPASRRSCFRSTIPEARALAATASEQSSSTTSRSSCPIPGRASRKVRSIPGPSRATSADVAALTAGAVSDWIAHLELTPFQRAVAVHIFDELAARVSFVNDVGLGYLTLDRLTRTLSGGEAQRIALSNALGAHLVDTLYVLDEPTIGLHPADTGRLLGLLRRLADGGNTVVVVEHDPAAMRAAGWMVELGHASGGAGGG